MQWKLIRTKTDLEDDPDYCIEQNTYPDEEIYAYTGPHQNSGAAFYCEFFAADGTPMVTRGTFGFTVFERATWGDPAKHEWHDIDGLEGTNVEAFRRVNITGLSLETARFGVRLYDFEPPENATGIRVYAVAYV